MRYKRTGKGIVTIGNDEYPEVRYVLREYKERSGDLKGIKSLFGVLKPDKQLRRVFQNAPKSTLRLESGEEIEILFDSEASGPGWTPFMVKGDFPDQSN
jgi:hypothetical protein